MNQDYFTLEDCKATWRQEARARANQEAEATGLAGDAALEKGESWRFIVELERLGNENIS